LLGFSDGGDNCGGSRGAMAVVALGQWCLVIRAVASAKIRDANVGGSICSASLRK
jgi:hypothetical protein